MHALAEIVHIVGRRPLQLAANRVGRCFKIRNCERPKEMGMSFSTHAKLILSRHKKVSVSPGGGLNCNDMKCRYISAIETKSGRRCHKADREWPDEVWELLDRMLAVDQLDRISAKEALKLPFFTDFEI